MTGESMNVPWRVLTKPAPARVALFIAACAGSTAGALEVMAFLHRDVSLHDEIRDARRDLEAADEQSDEGCSPLAV
jgi:hypothetical protein